MIDIEAVGAIAVLFENLSFIPNSSASGHGPLSSARSIDALSTFCWIFLMLYHIIYLKMKQPPLI